MGAVTGFLDRCKEFSLLQRQLKSGPITVVYPFIDHAAFFTLQMGGETNDENHMISALHQVNCTLDACFISIWLGSVREQNRRFANNLHIKRLKFERFGEVVGNSLQNGHRLNRETAVVTQYRW